MVTAYSPLARGKVPGDETLRAIGERTARPRARSRCAGCSTSRNVATIPKASSHERRLENFEVFDFEFSDDDRAQIDALPEARAHPRSGLGARLGGLLPAGRNDPRRELQQNSELREHVPRLLEDVAVRVPAKLVAARVRLPFVPPSCSHA